MLSGNGGRSIAFIIVVDGCDDEESFFDFFVSGGEEVMIGFEISVANRLDEVKSEISIDT